MSLCAWQDCNSEVTAGQQSVKSNFEWNESVLVTLGISAIGLLSYKGEYPNLTYLLLVASLAHPLH